MGFLDKLNQTLNKAGEKATEMANVAKIKMDISKYQGSVNSKYAKLGELVYKSEKEGLDIEEEAKTYVNEIDMLFEEIKKLNLQLAELNEKDEPMPQEAGCGCDGPCEPQDAQVEGKVCANCGKSNDMAAGFCAGCGTKLG